MKRVEFKATRALGRRVGYCWDCQAGINIGVLRCYECRDKQRVREMRYAINHRNERRESSRQQRLKRIADNRCKRCARPLDEDADHGKEYCQDCREKTGWTRYETLYDPDARRFQLVPNRG